MKVTIDIPDELLRRAELTAAQRHTTLRDLVVSGLETVIKLDSDFEERKRRALERARKGFSFKGEIPSREELYDRRSIS